MSAWQTFDTILSNLKWINIQDDKGHFIRVFCKSSVMINKNRHSNLLNSFSAADSFIVSPLCHAGTASSHPAWCVDQHLKLDSSMCSHNSVWFWTDIMSISFIYCLAQPQLQLQLWPRLALILISPATHPPTEKVFFSKAKQSYELIYEFKWTWILMHFDELRWT